MGDFNIPFKDMFYSSTRLYRFPKKWNKLSDFTLNSPLGIRCISVFEDFKRLLTIPCEILMSDRLPISDIYTSPLKSIAIKIDMIKMDKEKVKEKYKDVYNIIIKDIANIVIDYIGLYNVPDISVKISENIDRSKQFHYVTQEEYSLLPVLKWGIYVLEKGDIIITDGEIRELENEMVIRSTHKQDFPIYKREVKTIKYNNGLYQ